LPREGKAEKAKGKAAHTVIHKHGAAAPGFSRFCQVSRLSFSSCTFHCSQFTLFSNPLPLSFCWQVESAYIFLAAEMHIASGLLFISPLHFLRICLCCFCCSCWPATIPSFVFWEVKEDGFRAPGFGSLVEGLFTNFYAAVMPKCIVNGRSSI